MKTRIKNKFFPRKVSQNLSKRFRLISGSDSTTLKDSFIKHHYTLERGFKNGFLSTEHGKKSFQDAVYDRLNIARYQIVPWICDTKSLENLNVLEIGCGSGSGTVALAEQASFVIGLDIDESILKVAQERCSLHQFNNVKFHNLDIFEFAKISRESIDVVIFYASLEHMLFDERIKSIKTAWDILPSDGLLIVIDTPNRLFYYDGHTTALPFFYWLSDEAAFKYIDINPSSIYKNEQFNYKSKNDFLKMGRGISYHDFEISLNQTVDKLDLISSLSNYESKKYYFSNLVLFTYRLLTNRKKSIQKRYISLMSEYQPDIDPAFFEPYLNIIIKKTNPAEDHKISP